MYIVYPYSDKWIEIRNPSKLRIKSEILTEKIRAWGPVGRGKGADSELATSERVRSTWEAVTECACSDTESLSDSVSKAGTLPAPPPPALLTLMGSNSIK